jgi:hypothetical protein
MHNGDDLPDDIATLKALLVAQKTALAQSQNQVAVLTQTLSSRELQIEALQLQILALRRRQFGRKSEQLDTQIEQLELKLEELQTDEGQSLPTDIPDAEQICTEFFNRRLYGRFGLILGAGQFNASFCQAFRVPNRHVLRATVRMMDKTFPSFRLTVIQCPPRRPARSRSACCWIALATAGHEL